MTTLVELGAISKEKARGMGAYDPAFAAEQAKYKHKQPWSYRTKEGAKRGFKAVKGVRVTPKTAVIAGAGTLGTAGIAGLAAHDRAAQKRVARDYGPQPEDEKRRMRNLTAGTVGASAAVGGYVGYGSDIGWQAGDIGTAHLKAQRARKAKQAYERTGAGSGEKFASERERIRVERLRGMAGSHNPHEASNAEDMLRGMGRDPKGHTSIPWEQTKGGAKHAKQEAKFKARYGQGWSQTNPMDVHHLKPKMSGIALRRSALIGAGAAGASAYAGQRYTNRKLRREEALVRAEKKMRRDRRRSNFGKAKEWEYSKTRPAAWKHKERREKVALGVGGAGVASTIGGVGLIGHGADDLGGYYNLHRQFGVSHKDFMRNHKSMPIKRLAKIPGIKRVAGGALLLGAGQAATTGGAWSARGMQARREIRNQEKRRVALKAKGYM